MRNFIVSALGFLFFKAGGSGYRTWSDYPLKSFGTKPAPCKINLSWYLENFKKQAPDNTETLSSPELVIYPVNKKGAWILNLIYGDTEYGFALAVPLSKQEFRNQKRVEQVA